MFYKIKEHSDLSALTSGIIVTNKVFVEDQELHILNNDEELMLKNNKWYVKTPLTNNNYLYLGVGSFPNCTLEVLESEILRANDFNLLFEEITQENENN